MRQDVNIDVEGLANLLDVIATKVNDAELLATITAKIKEGKLLDAIVGQLEMGEEIKDKVFSIIDQVNAGQLRANASLTINEADDVRTFTAQAWIAPPV